MSSRVLSPAHPTMLAIGCAGGVPAPAPPAHSISLYSKVYTLCNIVCFHKRELRFLCCESGRMRRERHPPAVIEESTWSNILGRMNVPWSPSGWTFKISITVSCPFAAGPALTYVNEAYASAICCFLGLLLFNRHILPTRVVWMELGERHPALLSSSVNTALLRVNNFEKYVNDLPEGTLAVILCSTSKYCRGWTQRRTCDTRKRGHVSANII